MGGVAAWQCGDLHKYDVLRAPELVQDGNLTPAGQHAAHTRIARCHSSNCKLVIRLGHVLVSFFSWSNGRVCPDAVTQPEGWRTSDRAASPFDYGLVGLGNVLARKYFACPFLRCPGRRVGGKACGVTSAVMRAGMRRGWRILVIRGGLRASRGTKEAKWRVPVPSASFPGPVLCHAPSHVGRLMSLGGAAELGRGGGGVTRYCKAAAAA